MAPMAWMGMPVCKLLTVLFLAYITEGKPKEDAGVLPIEVVLAPQANRRSSSSAHRVLKSRNRALRLQIHPGDDDSGEDGDVDLLIAATKEVAQAAFDRYSPAFNAQLTSKPSMSRTWDPVNSLQDSFQSAELFPYASLRQALQTPQPLVLGRSQFSPLQGYSDNSLLQTQFMMPYMRSYGVLPQSQILGNQPQGLPLFLDGLQHQQQGHQPQPQQQQQTAQQYGSPQQHGNPRHQQHIGQQQYGDPRQQVSQQYGNPQQQQIGQQLYHAAQHLNAGQNLPLNRYSLLSAPSKRPEEPGGGGEGHQRPLAVPAAQNRPFHQSFINEPAPQQNQAPPQSVPDILGHTRHQVPPLQNRPDFALPRTLQININTPGQREPYRQQQQLPQQTDFLRNLQQQATPAYQANQNSLQQQNQPLPLGPYANSVLYPNAQQLGVLQQQQQRPLPGSHVAPNDLQQALLYRSRDLHQDQNRLKDPRPPLRDPNSRPHHQYPSPNFLQHGSSPANQHTLAISDHPSLANSAPANQAFQNRGRHHPVHPNSLDGTGIISHSKAQQHQSLASGHHRHRPQGLIQQQSSLDFASRPAVEARGTFHEGPTNERGDGQVLDSSEEKASSDGDGPPPVKPKKRRKNKKKVPKKAKEEAMESQASHQYIIKIGLGGKKDTRK